MRNLVMILLAGTMLASCGERDTRLPGPREAALPGTLARTANQAPALRLAAPRANASWTHIMGDADHHIAHPALGTALQPLFSVPFGAGEDRSTRISAAPVIAGGRIFVMDARANVVALSQAGAPLWTRSLKPNLDSAQNGAGGGLAYGGGKLYATSGFGKLSALDPATGRVLWRQDLDAPGGAPTVSGDLVYVMGRDGTAWAIETENGRIRWTARGAAGQDSFGTGAAPAMAGELAILPFPEGELRGAFAQGGLQRWQSFIAGGRTGFAASMFSHLSADPVVHNGKVYAANIAGRAAALDAATGEEIWSLPMGAKAPMQPAGNSVFFVNDLNQLTRVNATTGAVIWQQELPKFGPGRRSSRFFAHYGPILAGRRLNIASSDGMLRQFDPRTGGLTASHQLPAPAASQPAIANGTLYVVTTDGKLTAFR